MKAYISIILSVALLWGSAALTVSAEETRPTDPPASTAAAEPTQKPETPTDPVTQPTQPAQPTEPTVTEPEPTTQPTQPCSHSFGDWGGDETSHWRTCTACGHRESAGHTWAAETITVEPTCGEPGGVCKVCTVCEGVLVTQLIEPTGKHSYTNACDTSCNTCGAQRTVEHSFSTGWKYSYKGHWHYCTICGAEGEIKDHYPGPAATEEKDQICLTCGYVMTKKKEHTHKWDSAWSSDEAGHWHSCTTCQEKDSPVAHSYEDGCDTACDICGYTRTAAHTYGPEWEQTESAHYGICTVCGEHSPEEEHTADSTGTRCSVCGYAMEPEETAHEHEFQEDTWGFDEDGHWMTCMCGEKDNAAPHVWEEGEKKGGKLLYTCEVCGAEKQEEAPDSGFPWLLLAAGGGILVCLIGIVICIIVIRRNKEEYA